jgi:hypothetical protein
VALNWGSISAADVEKACTKVASLKKDKMSGIVVLHRGRALPAKEVLKVAYRLANRLDETTKLKFSSGDATLAILRELGFEAERRGRNVDAGPRPPY